MNKLPQSEDLFEEISQLVEQARRQVQRSVNTAMVQTYWHIGRLILEHEQRGERRAGARPMARHSSNTSPNG